MFGLSRRDLKGALNRFRGAEWGFTLIKVTIAMPMVAGCGAAWS